MFFPYFVSFAESKRTNFKLDLLKLKSAKMEKVGEWTPLDGLNITDKYAFTHGNEHTKKILTEHVTIFKLQNLSNDKFYEVKKRCMTDLKALNF